jgi:hypothetical protein
MSVARDLLSLARRHGIELRANAGSLRLRADTAPPAKLLDQLREHKADLLALLSSLPPLTAENHEAIVEAIEERAAIREFDGGESSEAAEREARSALRVHRYRMTDKPDIWLTMIAPGCSLEDAARDLRGRFGERLLEVVEQVWRSRR